MAVIPDKLRLASPHSTIHSTDRNTFPQDVWKISATSFQDNRLAQPARNCMYAHVNVCLPSAHGTASTFTPHHPQSTRIMTYEKKTAITHNGTDANNRPSSVPY